MKHGKCVTPPLYFVISYQYGDESYISATNNVLVYQCRILELFVTIVFETYASSVKISVWNVKYGCPRNLYFVFRLMLMAE
jgi:hypothetical protein